MWGVVGDKYVLDGRFMNMTQSVGLYNMMCFFVSRVDKQSAARGGSCGSSQVSISEREETKSPEGREAASANGTRSPNKTTDSTKVDEVNVSHDIKLIIFTMSCCILLDMELVVSILSDFINCKARGFCYAPKNKLQAMQTDYKLSTVGWI